VSAVVHYEITPANPAAHMFEVRLRVEDPHPDGQQLVMPAWIPGSYLIREFAKNVVRLTARDNNGPVVVTKLGKDTWRAAPSDGPLIVDYEVYSWDLSVRMAHLDRTHGYFNGTSVFLRVVGQEQAAHRVCIALGMDPACQTWTVHTTLPRIQGDAHGAGLFQQRLTT
jgi:predicted metalloprotease with PDZ domain